MLGQDVPHQPVLVYFDTYRVTTPAHVCWRCSDPDAGRWVPLSQCAPASELDDDGQTTTVTFANDDDADDGDDGWERLQDEGRWPAWM